MYASDAELLDSIRARLYSFCGQQMSGASTSEITVVEDPDITLEVEDENQADDRVSPPNILNSLSLRDFLDEMFL